MSDFKSKFALVNRALEYAPIAISEKKPREQKNSPHAGNLGRIIPRNSHDFLRTSPRPKFPVYIDNLDRSSSSSSQEESSVAEEASKNSEDKTSGSEFEKSPNTDQRVSDPELIVTPTIGNLSISDGPQTFTSLPWRPDAETLRRQHRATAADETTKARGMASSAKPPLTRQTRQLTISLNVAKTSNPIQSTHTCDAEFSASPTRELDHSLASPRSASRHAFSPRQLLSDLVPKIKTTKINDAAPETEAEARQFDRRMTRKLLSSEIYKTAQNSNEAMGTLRPAVLESYLKSLLKDDRARQTIKDCKLTAAGAVAIRYYTLEGFNDVQSCLRGEKACKNDSTLDQVSIAPAGSFDSLITACIGAFARLPPLPPGTQLFRGTNFLFDDQLQSDQTYLDPAFVSASTSQKVATDKFAGRFLLIFEVPEKDPRFRDVGPLTGNKNEDEVLGLPGIRFRVVSRGGDGGAPMGEGTPENPEIVRLSPIAII